MDALSALGERFGSQLSLERSGEYACFHYDGQSAALECGRDGFVRAIFSDRPARDAGMGRTWTARYRRSGASYTLEDAGCERLARDVADFFSGIREPEFVFESLD